MSREEDITIELIFHSLLIRGDLLGTIERFLFEEKDDAGGRIE